MRNSSKILILSVLIIVFNQGFGQNRITEEKRFTSDSLNGIYIPKNLVDCMIQIDHALDTLMKSGDPHLPSLEHYWQLSEGSRLSKYFNDHGVKDPYDMEGVMLYSYKTYKTDSIEIKIDQQVSNYLTEKIKYEKQRREKDSVRLSEYSIGDTVFFEYDILGYTSKRQEEMDMSEKCTAHGIVLARNYESHFLKIMILNACDKRGIIYYDDRKGVGYDATKSKWVKEKGVKATRVKKYAKSGDIVDTPYHYWEKKMDE